jgi:hypothetical protein
MKVINTNFEMITKLNNFPNRYSSFINNEISQDKVCFSGTVEKTDSPINFKQNIIIKSPNNCTKKELKDFEKLIIEGKQVSEKGLFKKISNAKVLAFCYIDNEIASISAVKIPKNSYREKVFRNAGVTGLVKKYLYELGYSYTKPEYRGKGLNISCSKELLTKLKSGI